MLHKHCVAHQNKNILLERYSEKKQLLAYVYNIETMLIKTVSENYYLIQLGRKLQLN